jgi:hypothetical protein
MLVVLGVVTFYLVPSSFINQNMSLFFFVFNMILVMIIFGMTFLAVLIFALLERLLKWLTLQTCCRKDRSLSDLIQKNMDGHRKRNSKTSIMLTLSLAFSIFASATFLMINTLITSEVKSLAGSDLYANAISGNSFLDEPALRDFLDGQPDSVNSYAFVTASGNSIFGKSKDDYHQYTSGMAGFDMRKTDISGVPEHYMSVLNTEFYIPTYLEKDAVTAYLPNG